MSPTTIFAPASTPADAIAWLSVLVLGMTGGIFVVVCGLLIYTIVRFRRRHDEAHEPAQVYGSNQVELAWTVVPMLIVVVLFLATARVITRVQEVGRPDEALQLVAVGHQFWWEYRYPGDPRHALHGHGRRELHAVRHAGGPVSRRRHISEQAISVSAQRRR